MTEPVVERHPAPGQDPDYRFTLANERTFLAWIRTSLALIAGGVAIAQLLPPFPAAWGRPALATLLVVAGAVLAVASVRRWQRVQDAMRADDAMPTTRLPAALTAFLLVVCVAVVVTVVAGRP
jgi:putative membrane protein